MTESSGGRAVLPAAFSAAMAARFGERFSTAGAVCRQQGRDESSFAPVPPDAVVFVESTAEVAAVAGLCCAHRVPMIAHGAGTSLEGQLLAVAGGVSIDFTGLNRVLAIRPGDLDATVQAGVTRKQLNEALRAEGLFFPIDPGADASLGGMAATRASGTNAVRYGTMRENVLALTAVLADGRVIHTGTRARKSAAGYDLTHLLLGSEGTLALITELTVRLHPVPESIGSAVCAFPDVDAAVRTVMQTIQLGVPVARIEIVDAPAIGAINAYSRLTLRELPTLFFEFHGSAASVEEQTQTVQALAAEHGGLGFEWATLQEERSRLWQARHSALYAALALRPGCRALTTDVCVPISRLADCIGETGADLAASGLVAPMVGHVGDGNFHMIVLVDPADAAEVDRAEAFAERLAERAIRMEGTCTGEHGIGLGKRRFMVPEHGADGVETMRAIKAALDPLALLNPGKVLPD